VEDTEGAVVVVDVTAVGRNEALQAAAAGRAVAAPRVRRPPTRAMAIKLARSLAERRASAPPAMRTSDSRRSDKPLNPVEAKQVARTISLLFSGREKETPPLHREILYLCPRVSTLQNRFSLERYPDLNSVARAPTVADQRRILTGFPSQVHYLQKRT
jgi:hypothetical protein